MKILIAIPVINLWSRYTEECLKSIQCKYEHQIMIIDNHSQDETQVKMLELSGQDKKYLYIRNEENWGVQKSWNYAINYAKENGFDYILLPNNDVLFHKSCIDLLIDKFENSDNDIVMITANDIRLECENTEKLFEKNPIEKTTAPDSPHPNFSAFMVRKDFFDIVGEFDEGFYPAYFEDNDMHYRIRLVKKKAIAIASAMFYHFGSQTQNQVSGGMVNSSLFLKNRDYYVQKWGGEPNGELFITPFNNSQFSIKWTKQKPI